ncbi:MAG: hypothetical protein IJ430_07540 [Parabacteroides sp.]|nr:hypothetical protein [Parabacteroides sp.]
MSKPVEIEFLMKDRLTPGLDKAAKGVDSVTGKASSANAELEKTKQQAMDLRNLIALLENQLEELRLVGENASPDLDQSRNIAHIENLQKQIEELKEQLKQLENVSEHTNVVPPELPQAKKQFNGLHNSIQQMAREMPSLAMGPQMFFLAISNNLPIFTDELVRARKEYDALIKTGQKATPVWKQILSSLFSWQTAITTGIMLLVMYGDEFVEWCSNLFKGEKQLSATERAQRGLTEAIKKNGYGIGNEIVALRKLSDEWLTLGDNMDAKKKFITDNQTAFEKLGVAVTTTEEAENLLVRNTQAFVDSLTKRARAAAGMKLAADAYEEALKKQVEADKMSDKVQKQDVIVMNTSAGAVTMGTGKFYEVDNEEKKRLKKEVDDLNALAESYIKVSEELEKNAEKGLSDVGIKEKEEKQDKNAQKEAEKAADNLEKANEMLLAMREQNTRAEIGLMEEGTKKKLAQIALDYDTRKAEIARREKELAELNKKAGGDGTLTEEQQTEIDEANRLNAENRKQEELAVYRAETDAMREFLKEYGTYQQQKLAIAEEYAEKIGKAETEGERMILAKQRDKALAGIDIKAAKEQVDWQSVFSGFGGVLQEQIQPTIENLKRITRSEEFKNAPVRDQQELYNIIAELERDNAKLDSESFKKVADDLELFRNSLNRYNEALERRDEAEERLSVAKATLKQAEGDGADTSEFQAEVDAAQEAYDRANESVETFSDILNENSKDLNESATRISNSLNGVAGGLSKLKSGSLQTSFEGLQDLGGIIGGKVGDALANMDPTGIISGVLGIVDVLKGGVSSIFVDLQDMVFGAVDGILSDIFSGDILVKTLESTVKGVGGILDTVTFGGFSSLFGSGESDKNLERDIEYLTASNDNLRQSIDNLADKMEDTAVSEASGVYERQKELLEQQMANTQEMMQRSGAAYSNGFLGIGGSHSSNHKINEGMSSADWKLSSEEMAKVADEARPLFQD